MPLAVALTLHSFWIVHMIRVSDTPGRLIPNYRTRVRFGGVQEHTGLCRLMLTETNARADSKEQGAGIPDCTRKSLVAGSLFR